MKHLRNVGKLLVLVGTGLCLAATCEARPPLPKTFEVNVSPYILYKNPHNGDKIVLGGFSGLFPVPSGTEGTVYTVTDRGPGPDFVDVSSGDEYKIWPRPDFGPALVTIKVLPGGVAQVLELKQLTKPDGSIVTGLPVTNPKSGEAYDMNLEPLPTDEDAIDAEGLTIDRWGNFWVSEEYKPSVAMVSPEGVVQMRLVPQGTRTGTEIIPTQDILPAVLSKRVDNRGMEGIAATPNGKIYAILQRPLANPNKLVSNGGTDANGNTIPPSSQIRLVEIDVDALATGGPGPVVRQFIYVTDTVHRGAYASDLFALNNATFLVSERNTDKLFAIDIQGATDITPLEDANGKLLADPDKTIEMLAPAELAAYGITPVQKAVVLDSLTAIDPQLSKCEGVCVIGPWIVLTHDNDFNVDIATLATPPPQESKGPLLEINLQDPPNLPKLFAVPMPQIIFDH